MTLEDAFRDDLRAIDTYCGEVVTQATFAHIAYQALREEMQLKSGRDITACFAYAQMILTAGAQISKLFWPPTDNKASKWRAEQLRAILNPSEELKSRSVRNSFEHFDEELDRWFATAEGRPLIDRIIAPDGAFWNGLRDEPHVALRRINPDTTEISVLTNKVSLKDLYLQIADVSTRAKARIER